MIRRELHLLLISILFLSLLFSCTKDNETPTGPDGDTDPVVGTIVVTPSSGNPGSMIHITGYTINPSDSNIVVYVGDQPTVYINDSTGIQALIPLFLDFSSNWSQPPVGLQDVTIRVDSQIVAIAKEAIEIDSLPHADGATETIVQDLQVVSSSMRSIMSSLNGIPNADERLPGYRSAILMMLDSILTGSDSSIAALINGTSGWNNGQQLDMSLIDAVLASSGALEFYNDMSSSLGQLNKALNSAQSAGLLCKSGGEDMDLACEMQIYVVLDNYANYFVKPTTTTYANTVGLTAGLLAVSGVGLAGEAIIGALLTVFDFVYGTLAPSLFPAEITQFALEVQTTSIAVDELTSTDILISATNKPATITATQILDQLLGALGLAKASQIAESFKEVLKNAMSFALDLYRKAVVQYNQDTGGSVFIDPEADLPPLFWGPITITNNDLVELFSFTESIISADTSTMEWKGVSRGDGRIQARGRGAGEKSKVLIDNALCWGCVYSGGAFGENAPGTETKTVTVGKPASLMVEINGLPSGTDGNVIVSGTDYSSGRITATETLSDLEPGDYTVTAVEVQDVNGYAYIPEPVSNSVTLADDDNQTVTITYEAEFGSMLLTVTGLPTEIDANITVSGEGGTYQVYSDTLLDSLSSGTYTITAYQVLDNDGVTYLLPSPQNQNINIIGGQTVSSNVTYSKPVSLKVFTGSYTHTLTYFNEYYTWMSSARCGSSDGDTLIQNRTNDSIFVPDLSFNSSCNLEGGIPLEPGESISTSSSCGSGTASGSINIAARFEMEGNEINITGSLNVSASPPSPKDSTPFAQYGASVNVGGPSPSLLILEVDNREAKNLAFIIEYSATINRHVEKYGSSGAGLISNLYSLNDCIYNNIPEMFHLYADPPEDSSVFSGVDTLLLGTRTLVHLASTLNIGGQAGASVYTDQDGQVDVSGGGDGSASCAIRFRLIELQQ